MPTLADILHYNYSDSSLYAALVAILLVHIILALFVYAAWKEEFPRPSPADTTRANAEKED
jgi:H+/gluconate symporter-like permease